MIAERIRGARPEGGRRAGPRLAEGARPAREARALPPLGRDVRALPLADRAARLAAVVVRDGRARRAGDRGAARAARPLPPREPAPLRDRVARAGARLVRLAPALVGAPDPDLDVPRRPPDLRVADRPTRAPSAARASSSATPTCSTRGSRSALWPFATLGWPRRDAGARALLPAATSTSTAREIIRLWENRMIFSGLVPARRRPVHRRDHPLDRARPRRAAHVEEPRHRASTRWSRSRSTARTRRATGSSRSRPPRTSASRRARSRRGASSRTSSGTSRG